MATWNPAYEATPAGSDDPSEGDDRIQEDKVETRTRLEKEHTWGGTSAADGPHKQGSAKIYFQAATPTNRPDGSTALTDDDAGRLFMSSAVGVLQAYDSSSDGFLPVAAGAVQETGANSIILKSKVISIGSWNMDSDGSIAVDHGLGANYRSIRTAEAVIYGDNGTTAEPLNRGFNVNDGTPQGWISTYASVGLAVVRLGSGLFDSTDFNSTGFNRGWVTIWYST